MSCQPDDEKDPFSGIGPDFPFDYENWLSKATTHDEEEKMKRGPLGSVPPGLPEEDQRVAIIGAGIAGMVAAYELSLMGLEPIVYEAGDDVGGRLRSVDMRSDEDIKADRNEHLVAELGGMRFPASGKAFNHYVSLFELHSKKFPNPMEKHTPFTVIDLESRPGEPLLVESDLLCEAVGPHKDELTEVKEAWKAAKSAALDDLQAAMAAKDVPEIKRLWQTLIKDWDDKSFWNFVAESTHFESYKLRETFGHVGFGVGGWDSDFPNTMLEIFRVLACEYHDDQMMIVGGSQKLPRALWAGANGDLSPSDANGDLSPSDANVARLRGQVTSVIPVPKEGSDGVRFKVVARKTNEDGFTYTQEEIFSTVLVTPQSCLYRTSLGMDDQLFESSMWPAFERTTYMSSSKTFVKVKRAFWKDEQYRDAVKLPFSMTVTDRSTRATYLIEGDSADDPALVILSYAWETDARKVLSLDPNARKEVALEVLEEIYGKELPLRDQIVGEPVTVSWSTNPNFLGAFKGALPGHYRYNRMMYSHFYQEQFDPEHQGIFLAGDGISWTPGWAEGAVQTALNAVWGIMKHLGGASFEKNPGPGDQWADLQPYDPGD